MRTFRFRAWDGKEGKFVGGEWELLPMMFEDGNYIYGMDYSKIVVEQFTGILDKNGVEIYEGDIITFASSRDIMRVFWDVKTARYCMSALEPAHVKYPDNYGLGMYISESIVIGSIHDNPDKTLDYWRNHELHTESN